jgi:predicted O-methyltransferase YrrM
MIATKYQVERVVADESGLADRLTLIRRLLLRDPALLADYCRWFIAERLPQRRSLADPSPVVSTVLLADACERIRVEVGAWEDGPALGLARAHWTRSRTDGSNAAAAQSLTMAADTTLGELAYALVRAIRPDVVVETGVATGVTSAFILAALADNDSGVLHSVDLPPTRLLAAGLVGIAVPPELERRWTYHWGSSRRLLPGLLRAHRGSLPLFIHDSDHSYSAMRWEVELAWTALAPGGWLIADDAHLHSAVPDVARHLGARPQYIQQTDKTGCTALLRKPKLTSPDQEELPRASGAHWQLQRR